MLREKHMKKKRKSEMDDELRPEYDLHELLRAQAPQSRLTLAQTEITLRLYSAATQPSRKFLSLRDEKLLQFSYERRTEIVQTRESFCRCRPINWVHLQLRLLGFGDQLGIPQRFDKTLLKDL